MVAATRVVLLSLVLLCAVAFEARTEGARPRSFGAQLGLDRTGVEGNVPSNSEYSPSFGLVVGLQGQIELAPGVALSLQPSFAQKRSGILKAGDRATDPPTENDLALDYVSFPIVAKFAKAGGVTYVSGGITVDFLTAAKLTGEGAELDVMWAYNRTALTAVLGFGVVFPAGGSRITTELRLNQGMTNLTHGGAAEAAGALAPRIYSSGLQFIVSTLRPRGKR